jgi:hypothetical protein
MYGFNIYCHVGVFLAEAVRQRNRRIYLRGVGLTRLPQAIGARDCSHGVACTNKFQPFLLFLQGFIIVAFP